MVDILPEDEHVVVYGNEQLHTILGDAIDVMRGFAVESDPARSFSDAMHQLMEVLVSPDTPRKPMRPVRKAEDDVDLGLVVMRMIF